MRRSRPVMWIAGVALAALAAGLPAQGVSSEGPSRADILAKPDPIEFGVSDPAWTGSALIGRAEEMARGVPLPAGGNFSGIRWKEAGFATDADIAFVLQHNAACQWLRAVADGRDPEAAGQAWREIPEWPAMRLGGNAGLFLAALDQVKSGESGAAPHPLLEACRASNRRERAYALAERSTPPI